MYMQERLIKLRKSRYDIDQALVPEHLRLPDGRKVAVMTLVNRASKSAYINLLNKTATDSAQAAHDQKRGKYTLEERRWIATADPRKILDRYPHVVITYLKSFIKQSRDIVQAADEQKQHTMMKLP